MYNTNGYQGGTPLPPVPPSGAYGYPPFIPKTPASRKHPIIFGFLIVLMFFAVMNVIAIIIYLIIGILMNTVVDRSSSVAWMLTDDWTIQSMAEFFTMLFGLLAIKIFGCQKCLKEKGRGVSYGIICSMYFIVISVLAAASNLIAIFEAKPLPQLSPIWRIAAYIICFVLVGLTEEFYFRGVVANLFYDKHAKDPAGVWTATLYSGLVFGLMHLCNAVGIFAAPSLKDAMQQAIGPVVQTVSATAMGILLAAIYFRCRNIWVMAGVHAFIDICAGIYAGLTTEATLSSTIESYTPSSLLSIAPFLIATVVLLRPKKLREIVDYRNGWNVDSMEYKMAEARAWAARYFPPMQNMQPMQSVYPANPTPANQGYPVNPAPTQQRYTVDPTPTQQGYTVDPATTQQGYPVNPATTQQGYPVDPATTQQGYPVDPATTQQGYPIDPATTQQGCPVDPATTQQDYYANTVPIQQSSPANPIPAQQDYANTSPIQQSGPVNPIPVQQSNPVPAQQVNPVYSSPYPYPHPVMAGNAPTAPYCQQPSQGIPLSINNPSSKKSKISLIRAIIVVAVVVLGLHIMSICLYTDTTGSPFSGFFAASNEIFSYDHSGTADPQNEPYSTKYLGDFAVPEDGRYRVTFISLPGDSKAYVTFTVCENEEEIFTQTYGGRCSDNVYFDFNANSQYSIVVEYDFSQVNETISYKTSIVVHEQ